MIEVSCADSIATITFENCLPLSLHDIDFALALRDAVRDAADSDDTKVIVIRASGENFSPAAVKQNAAAVSAGTQHVSGSKWHETYAASTGLYQNLTFCKKVVITAVHGECCGAGSLLVLGSDLTVATPDTVFGSPFATLPEANLVLAALTMRLNRTKSWVLSGTPLSAKEAFDAGLVNRIVSPDALDAQVRRMARAVARMPLDGIAMSKINVETNLDALGVGREFDMAGFYALALHKLQDEQPGQSKGGNP